MKSTTQLILEHKGIKLMLDVLSEICDRLEANEKIDPSDLVLILEFLQVFADKCHHGKEEDLLFPLLEKKGILKEHGPIGMMLTEHDKGRSLIRGLKENIQKYGKGDIEARNGIVENSRQYIDLLGAHIDKEDNILYPMANETLSPKEDEQLCKDFEKMETEKIGIGKHEEFHALLDKLSQIYLKPSPAVGLKG